MCDIYIMLMFIIWFWILQEPCAIGRVDAIYTRFTNVEAEVGICSFYQRGYPEQVFLSLYLYLVPQVFLSSPSTSSPHLQIQEGAGTWLEIGRWGLGRSWCEQSTGKSWSTDLLTVIFSSPLLSTHQPQWGVTGRGRLRESPVQSHCQQEETQEAVLELPWEACRSIIYKRNKERREEQS